ncbi:amidohydrolase family protein [Mycolicibacterium pulveris]|uniref:Amidohydrolase-related domain-containing protein n=1 Tax=Mycolicibacterium pulveris TaxID=36813 RepID=A0A7I7URJ8_MYCPV|nr:amidohydrolase family protein [Mycolicibacterium pulveris]MCV6983563.1 amidohydrolase family protein [Mycolicibacterium pulveris]BBY83443.1 hypothetical protein MPUL_46010 [Mycolicibacterium pulveris]
MSLVVDAVAHAYNLAPGNRAPAATADEFAAFRTALLGMHQAWSDPAAACPPQAFVSTWDAESLGATLFLQSDTDIAVYHDTALTPVFKDGGSPLAVGARLAELYPGRVLLYAGVDATAGARALEHMDRVVDDYEITGFKFYPVTGTYGPDGVAEGVLLNDVHRMYPLLEHARELGVRHIAIHKSVPFRRESVDPYLNINDVDAPAVAFPDLTFEVVHAGFAFLEETAFLLARHPNVYATLEISMNLVVRYPRRFARILGALLAAAGPDRILHATGCMLTHPQPVIEAFRAFEMPQDLVEEEGFPPVDHAVKEAILGGNALRLYGLTDAAVFSHLADDHVSRWRAEHGRNAPWSRLPQPDVAAVGSVPQ